MKKIIALLCAFTLLPSFSAAAAPDLEVHAKAAILTEQSTGTVLYESNPDERMAIASVTKIMTMLLIMEAIDSRRISMEDMVPVSENAQSYGGSTMFLEQGEQLSVHDMLKGIAVASANDGCVAMAEFLSGSEAAFVEQMNRRAAELGMTGTSFMNTNGLDEENHYSTARDVAIMSAELLKHEKIFEFTTIWTDTLRDGKFALANTNKLIRFYSGANGLKTGSTSKAGCCISATAQRDGMGLIAVVLGAENSKERFSSARALLDYGFASYTVENKLSGGAEIAKLPVKKGTAASIGVGVEKDCSILLKKGSSAEEELILPEVLTAPINAGDTVGSVRYTVDGELAAEQSIIALEGSEKKGFAIMLAENAVRLISGSVIG